jgi:hypothetical protein
VGVGEDVLVKEVDAEHGHFPFAGGFPDAHSSPRRTNASNFPEKAVLSNFSSRGPDAPRAITKSQTQGTSEHHFRITLVTTPHQPPTRRQTAGC